MADAPYTTTADDVVVVRNGEAIPPVMIALPDGRFVPARDVPGGMSEVDVMAWLDNKAGSRPEDME
jgi:hypothetical protein